jgi:sterol desaturase/sphingolipid hydroxylase (fatty acid hydroxylase superfamily)
MVLVQILLVKFLTYIAIIALLNIFQSNGFTINNLWPKEWAIGTQAILMVLIADFFRYWLHRLSHEWMPLWRLHAVHHSPHKLYSMNVGRFHPLEKSIQFIFDALPFIILGITENILALYFVFYSINGFFQHCNIKIYLGPLNYVISGPELHRWHHSVKIKESNKNFGNNLIVWDLLFGTWHLPKTKKVDQLGLINRNYPLGLIEQLKSPFINGLDQEKDD